jgi:hypothetical protein
MTPPTDFAVKSTDYDAKKYVMMGTIKVKKNIKPIALFINFCIEKLNENGLGIIVMPYDTFLNGKTYTKFRALMFKYIDILNIIKYPEIINKKYWRTSCVMIFTKKKYDSATQNNKFKYSEYFDGKINDITEINYNAVLNNKNFNLDMETYIDNTCDLIKNIRGNTICFADLFDIIKSNHTTNEFAEDINGKGKIITTSKKVHKNIDESKCKYDGEHLFMVMNGNIGKMIYYIGKCIFISLIIKLKGKNSNINLKYYYYYLSKHQKYLSEKCNKVGVIPSIDIDKLMKLKVPFPDINEQNIAVKKYDEISEKILEYQKKIAELNILLSQ